MERIKNFYQGKKVFLTGGTGFKGSWLCLLLHELGAKVYNYSLAPPTSPSLWELAEVDKLCTHFYADILDRARLQEKVLSFKPDIMIHLAAQSLVRPSYENPYATLEVNVMGTASVLEAVRSCPAIKSTLIVTSDKAYKNIGKAHPYTEEDRMGGHDPYSASKGSAELVVEAYRQSFFDTTKQGLASVRAGNVIGGGDFAKDRLIPDMAKAFSKGERVEIRYPKATRPWQHVLDPLYAYLLLAKELYLAPQIYSEGWNFGPSDNEAHTVEEVVKEFSTFWEDSQQDSSARYIINTEQQPHEATFLGLDCAKAHSKLSWAPRLTFQESIAWTATWYRAWVVAKQNIHTLCIKQLVDFLRK